MLHNEIGIVLCAGLQRKYIKTNVYDRRIEPLYTRNQIYYMVHFTFGLKENQITHTILDT